MESVMPAKKYIVRLSGEEREQLEALVKKGKAAAHKRLHAQILLTADVGEGGPGWKEQPISQGLGVSTRTVERVRERLVEQGLEAALKRAPQQSYKPLKLDGEGQAQLVALACSAPPEGRGRWTLQLLADRLVSLGWVDEISHETVRQVLKKTN
jgi:transposase